MPYYFIWGSLVLRGTDWTRMSNGVLEKHQGFTKNDAPIDVLPHKHLISNYSLVNGLASDYLESIANQNNTDSASNLKGQKKRKCDSGDFEEVPIDDSEEIWDKKGRQPNNIAEKINPSYQNKANIHQLENKCIVSKKVKKTEKVYQFSRFALNDIHFKPLDCKGKSKKAWVCGEIIVAYLEFRAPKTVFVLEDFDTLKIFSKNQLPLSKVKIVYIF